MRSFLGRNEFRETSTVPLPTERKGPRKTRKIKIFKSVKLKVGHALWAEIPRLVSDGLPETAKINQSAPLIYKQPSKLITEFGERNNCLLVSRLPDSMGNNHSLIDSLK